MSGLVDGLNGWLGAAGAAVALVAGILGLPPLIAKAKAARRADAVTTQKILPERVRLIHRDDEIATIMTAIQDNEFVLSVAGNIGVGKSAVVREVAHRLGEMRTRGGRNGRFGLLIWLDARNEAFDLTDLARALSLATGDQSLTTAAADQKAQALQKHLAAHPAVLAIDNLHLTASGTPPLIDFLRSLTSGSVAIVSANTPGRLAGPSVWLEELTEQATAELLVREGRRRGLPEVADAGPATLARTYRLIGGNPRAVELFVLACANGARGLDELLRQLESGNASLTDELYATVWNTVDGSGRSLLTVTAYLGSGVNREQLEGASGLPAEKIDRGIDQLRAAGLLSVRPDTGHRSYGSAPALRSFLLGHVPDAEFAAVAERLATHFIERFRRDWEDAAGASPHIDAIRRVITDLHARDRHQRCFELFEVTLDIFFTLGLFDDRIALGGLAYQSATALGRPDQRSLALSVISSTHAIRGENTMAVRTAEQGLAIARESGSAKEIARQLRCLGFSHFRAGDAQQALAIIAGPEDAELLAHNAGDQHNMIDIQSLAVAAYWHLGRLDEASVVARRFLDTCEQVPWERGKAYAIRHLAELALMRGDHHDATLLVDEARALTERYEDVRELVRIDLTQARLHLFQGHPILARASAATARDAAGRLSLLGEGAEAATVHRVATRTMGMPWRWLRRRRPEIRFTDSTVGGD